MVTLLVVLRRSQTLRASEEHATVACPYLTCTYLRYLKVQDGFGRVLGRRD